MLDLTTVWSGPFVTQLLADLGAEVIRIECPGVFPPSTKGWHPRPDNPEVRGSRYPGYAPPPEGRPDRPYNRHASNNSVCRGKLSVTMDVRRAAEREQFLRLVAASDVLVENFKTGTLNRLGIHESELLQVNPRLVVLRIPPTGSTGDWAHFTGFGGQFDGLSGLAWLCGHRDADNYETPATTYMDGATGPAGAFAVLAALNFRSATGRGQVVELAQMENVLTHLGDAYVDTQLGWKPEKVGNRDLLLAPQGMYRCRGDQWVAVTVGSDEAWVRLAETIGRPELGTDDRYASAAGRVAHHDELDELLAAWTATRDALDAFHALQGVGVAAAPMLDDPGLAADPQVAARAWIRPLPSRDVGTHHHIGQVLHGIPQAWRRGAPALGEDNEYVYREILGLDEAAYAQLVADRVASEDYLDRDGNPV